MFKHHRFSRALSALVLGSLLSAPAFALKITSDTVDDITLTGVPSAVDVILKDVSGGNSIVAVNVQPQTQTLTFPVNSVVKCSKSSNGYSHSRVGFGAFNPTFLDAGVVHHEENPNAGHTTWTGTKWITEAAATHNYQVSLNELKNPGKPSYQLDVLAEFNAAMDNFIQQGGTKLDFLKSNRTIEVERSVSVLGACWKGFSDKGYATHTKTVTIRIKYQGNPNLTAINAQLNGNMANQVQVGKQPMKVTTGQILPHAPNYVGACPVDLKFDVRMNGVGNGQVKYRINEGGSTVYNSTPVNFADGKMQHQFIIPVAYPGKFELNQKKTVTYTLHAMIKDVDAASWPSHYQPFGGKSWSYTCKPKVSVGVGPGGNQLAPNDNQQTPAVKPMRVQPQNAPPARAPSRDTQR